MSTGVAGTGADDRRASACAGKIGTRRLRRHVKMQGMSFEVVQRLVHHDDAGRTYSYGYPRRSTSSRCSAPATVSGSTPPSPSSPMVSAVARHLGRRHRGLHGGQGACRVPGRAGQPQGAARGLTPRQGDHDEDLGELGRLPCDGAAGSVAAAHAGRPGRTCHARSSSTNVTSCSTSTDGRSSAGCSGTRRSPRRISSPAGSSPRTRARDARAGFLHPPAGRVGPAGAPGGPRR